MHDSTACRQQADAAYKQLWSDVTGNAELEQHLLSQLHQVQGTIATIKASNLAGTAHPMAVLSKVQDTWGNSLVRKKTMGLDGFPKQRKRQKQTGSSGTAAAEQEAQPFSKPAPAMRKQGPRAQAKAVSAGKENSPAAANAQADAQVTAPPSTASAPTVRSKGRCGQCATCLNPRGKKGCLRNKSEREAIAAALPAALPTT